MKKLILLSILFIIGCTRDYECELEYLHIETGEIYSASLCEGERSCISYTVDWPEGKKDAEEQCEDYFVGQVSVNEYGEYMGTIQSCICEKAD